MSYSKQFPIQEKKNQPKPTTGRLWYNGNIILADKSFAILQHEKKKLIAMGYRKEMFKITY
nr:MAG TPA: hypothetical protein [Caudoviricetes sp.]